MKPMKYATMLPLGDINVIESQEAPFFYWTLTTHVRLKSVCLHLYKDCNL